MTIQLLATLVVFRRSILAVGAAPLMHRLAKSWILLAISAAVCSTGQAVTIETVLVGNAGNPGDTRYRNISRGSVDYDFRIGKYEVTNAQYAEFLNAVDPTGGNALKLYEDVFELDNGNRGIIFNNEGENGAKFELKPGRENNPATFITWYNAIRFANWLHNGQGNGGTEEGAYSLSAGAPDADGQPRFPGNITRNPGATWWVPSEDEWYKAAYHKNDGVTGNYWDYPTATDAVPFSDQPPGNDAPEESNTANFFKNDQLANGFDDGYAVTGSASLDNSQNYLTDVGAYTSSPGPYGTFDQGGNVREWNDHGDPTSGGFLPFISGGSWIDNSSVLRASARVEGNPGRFSSGFHGFRVATIVPEPGALPLAALAMIAPWHRRNRSA